MSAAESRKLMAVLYDDGIIADRVLSDLGYELRERGLVVQGLVQRNTFRRDRAKCDMELEELGSGAIFQLSKDRGKHAGGCRLDREAIMAAAVLIGSGLKTDCDILIVNKFGRSEAEGRGLRDILAEAVAREIVTLVGVPRRNSEVWQKFAEGLFDQCEISDARLLSEWLKDRTGYDPRFVGSGPDNDDDTPSAHTQR